MQISGEKLGYTLRAKYLDSLMRQETAYFESISVEALPAKIQEHFVEIPNSIGEKFSQCLTFCGMMLSGFIIAFTFAPNYGLLVILFFPIFFIVISVYGKLVKGLTI